MLLGTILHFSAKKNFHSINNKLWPLIVLSRSFCFLRKTSTIATPGVRWPSSYTPSLQQSQAFRLLPLPLLLQKSRGLCTLLINSTPHCDTIRFNLLSSYFFVHSSNSLRTCLHSSTCWLPLTWTNIEKNSKQDFISAIFHWEVFLHDVKWHQLLQIFGQKGEVANETWHFAN